MDKTIYLKPIYGMQIILLIISLIFILSGLYSVVFKLSDTNSIVYSVLYLVIGFAFMIYIFKEKIFMQKKYIKVSDKFIEIKRWIVTKSIFIKVKEISEIKFIASRVSIKYSNTQELINLDWISGQSRMELSKTLKQLAEENEIKYEVINIFDKFKEKK